MRILPSKIGSEGQLSNRQLDYRAPVAIPGVRISEEVIDFRRCRCNLKDYPEGHDWPNADETVPVKAAGID